MKAYAHPGACSLAFYALTMSFIGVCVAASVLAYGNYLGLSVGIRTPEHAGLISTETLNDGTVVRTYSAGTGAMESAGAVLAQVAFSSKVGILLNLILISANLVLDVRLSRAVSKELLVRSETSAPYPALTSPDATSVKVWYLLGGVVLCLTFLLVNLAAPILREIPILRVLFAKTVWLLWIAQQTLVLWPILIPSLRGSATPLRSLLTHLRKYPLSTTLFAIMLDSISASLLFGWPFCLFLSQSEGRSAWGFGKAVFALTWLGIAGMLARNYEEGRTRKQGTQSGA